MESCCTVRLPYDTMCDRRSVQQGFVIPLQQVVVVPYTLNSMSLVYPATELGGVIDDDVLSSRGALLNYTLTSITNLLPRFLGATR
jgi:hypothetical protein